MASTNLELDRFGGHFQLVTGALFKKSDLDKIGGLSLMSLMSVLRLLCYDAGSDTPGVGFPDLGSHCVPSMTGDLAWQVTTGFGVHFDSSQLGATAGDFDLAAYRPIVVDAVASGALSAHASNPRIDILIATPAWTDDEGETRDTVSPGSGSPESVNLRRRFDGTVSVVEGTPGASPAAPAVPAGSELIAYIDVPATSGAATVRDARAVLHLGSVLQRVRGLTEYAVTGLEVVENPAGVDQDVYVNPGVFETPDGRLIRSSGGLITLAAHVSDRVDRIVIDDTTGDVSVTTGADLGGTIREDQVVEAANPAPAGTSTLGLVWVDDTTIVNAKIYPANRYPVGAGAIQDGAIQLRHLPTEEHHHSIAGATMAVSPAYIDGVSDPARGGGELSLSADSVTHHCTASLASLPNGAEIVRAELVYGAATNPTVTLRLRRVRHADRLEATLATVSGSSTGAPVTLSTTSISNGVIDHDTYAYFVQVDVANDVSALTTVDTLKITYVTNRPRG